MEPFTWMLGAAALGAYGYRRPTELFRFAMRARLQAAGLRSHRVDLPGGRVRYWRGGRGRPLVFLHGFGTEAAVNWYAQLLAFTRDFDVIAPDLPGFGASGRPASANGISFQVQTLDALLAHLGIERIALVGHSMGGWISLAAAADLPGRVDRLVVVDAAGLRFDPDLALERALLPETIDDVRLLIRANFQRPMRLPSFVLRDVLRVARRDVTSRTELLQRLVYGNEHLDDRLATIAAPTLVVWGQHDPLTPPLLGERIANAIPGAELIVFENSAHSPNVEHPDRFNRVVRRFLVSSADGDAAGALRAAG